MGIISTLVGYYKQVMDATKELFIRILMAILIFLGYVLLSLFIYAVMRRIMVPQKLHYLPVHLQYDSKCLSRPASDDFSICIFPQADFLLNGGKKLLSSGQHYKIEFEMEVPESHANLNCGMFMVNLTFYSTNTRFLSTSARPTTIRYKSSILHFMSTAFFAVPLLLGLWEQKQLLSLVLFEDYYEPYGDGALSASVRVESNRVNIYSSALTVDANFSGFTYYLYQWPLTMSIIVVISILITLCTCTVLLWVRDVIQDFEERRAAGLQRRRGFRTGARGHSLEHRRERQTQGQRNGEPVVITATSSENESVSSVAPTAETVDDNSGERTAADDRSSGTVTPTYTQESSEVQDTESEISTGLGDIISNLQSLRRDVDNEPSTDTSSGEADSVNGHDHERELAQAEGRALETGELRHRTGITFNTNS